MIGIIAGFSVDYVVHLAHAYEIASGSTYERITEAFGDLGIYQCLQWDDYQCCCEYSPLLLSAAVLCKVRHILVSYNCLFLDEFWIHVSSCSAEDSCERGKSVQVDDIS